MMIYDWWRSRDTRERYVLGGGVVIVLIAVIYLLLEPALNERNRMQEMIPQLQADLLWMQTHAPELKAILNQEAPEPGRNNDNLSLATVQGLVNDMSLQEMVNELRPAANRTIYIDFSEINYPVLVDLMYRLRDETGSRIVKARFVRKDNRPGVIQAALTLGR